MSQTDAVDELQRRGIRQSYRVLTKEIKGVRVCCVPVSICVFDKG
jgi:hypothetical protein